MLIDTAIAWAAAIAREEGDGKDRERYHIQEDVRAIGGSEGAFLQSAPRVGCCDYMRHKYYATEPDASPLCRYF